MIFKNSVIFIRSLTSNLLHTSSILFLCLVAHTSQDTLKLFLLLMLDMIFLKIPLFHLLSLNGTRLTKIRKSESLNIFKRSILKLTRLSQKRVYIWHNPEGYKPLSRLRLGISHLHEHNFKHSYQETLKLMCNCGKDIEVSSHYLLHCPDYLRERMILLNTVSSIIPNISDFNNDQLTQLRLCDKEDLDNINNASMLDASNAVFFMLSRCHGFNIDIAFKIHVFALFFVLFLLFLLFYYF